MFQTMAAFLAIPRRREPVPCEVKEHRPYPEPSPVTCAVDRHRFNADPDPTFHCDGDPDLAPTPRFRHFGKYENF
jgi:hypothetical protein